MFSLSLEAVAIVVTFVLSAGAVISTALRGPRARARRRLQQGTSALADREVVTLVGTVRAAGDLLVAPLSGKRCVLYVALGHVKKAHAGEHYAETVAELAEHRMVPFELDTGDAVLLVDGTSAAVELPPVPIVPRKVGREVAFLEAHDHSAKLVANSGFDETTIEPGDRIAVQGMAIVELDPTATDERGYRESVPQKIRIVAHDAHPLTIGRPGSVMRA